ncbi:MAG: hypothetical protein ABI367_02260 [Mucilaginibacter sp.]
MKRTILLLLLTATLFSACKKDNSTPVETNYILFKVDGAEKTVKTCQGVYFKSNSINFTRITVVGHTDNNEQIGLDVVNPVVGQSAGSSQAGLYSVVAGVDTTFYMSNNNNIITINSLTTDRVTGTFQFTGTNYAGKNPGSKNITEGTFGCKVIAN